MSEGSVLSLLEKKTQQIGTQTLKGNCHFEQQMNTSTSTIKQNKEARKKPKPDMPQHSIISHTHTTITNTNKSHLTPLSVCTNKAKTSQHTPKKKMVALVALVTVVGVLLQVLGGAVRGTGATPAIHYRYLYVQEAIAGAKIRPSDVVDHRKFWAMDDKEANLEGRLKLIHRDVVSSGSYTSYHHRFEARLKRDARRVRSLTRRLTAGVDGGGFSYRVEEFGSEVVSGMEEGSGEYFVRIGVGSPSRDQYLVIDSGSDMVWVQCQPCTQCYQQADPVFDPADSATFAGVACGSTVCSRLENAGCRAGRCRYEVMYGDGSYTKGTLALETLTFGRTVVSNVAIGCGHSNRGLFVGASGLLGLGGGSLSFISQLGGQSGGAFGYCLVSRGSGSHGSLVIGRDAVPVGAVWVPLLRNPRAPNFYFVGLAGLIVGGTRVPIPEDVFGLAGSGEGGVIMDTGTAVTRFPVPAYEALRDAFIAGTTDLPRASGVSIFDTCYNLFRFEAIRVPTVSFYFSGGLELTLPARNFLIPVDDVGTFCFAFAPSPSGLSIIGNIQQEGIQITFDGANGFVGFGPNNC